MSIYLFGVLLKVFSYTFKNQQKFWLVKNSLKAIRKETLKRIALDNKYIDLYGTINSNCTNLKYNILN